MNFRVEKLECREHSMYSGNLAHDFYNRLSTFYVTINMQHAFEDPLHAHPHQDANAFDSVIVFNIPVQFSMVKKLYQMAIV